MTAGAACSSACLIVLDGWGLAPAGPGNAVSLAATPVFDDLWERFGHTQLTACGQAVGLPDGQMGNSEVGHLNLGAGAVVRQDLTRIDAAVADGTLAANTVLRDAMLASARVHLLGLVSDGGVHSSLDHLHALLRLGAELGVREVVVHAFTDGRDTLPDSGEGFVGALDRWCAETANARVASVIGRYFAMDRDRRWDRVQLAYDLLAHGAAPHHAPDAASAVRAAYTRDETDEFIAPTTIGAGGTIAPGDSVIAFNFRPDRMRQLTRALADPGFAEIDRRGAGIVQRYATLTEYEEGWPYPIAFPPARLETTLTRVIAEAGAAQLHVAETEKYPHVTYFFGGGEEEPAAGERRELVASPRDVATYDQRPEMSAREAASAFTRAWRAEPEPGYRFGIINFANPDMVGHTGVIPAAVAAIEVVDACLGDVVAAVLERGGACVVTADHGNADHMLEPDGSPNTAHSMNPVPLVVVAPDGRVAALRDGGILADVAPTILELLGIEQPAAMTGRSLLAGTGG